MAIASKGIVEQIMELFSYEGIVGIGQGILGSPLAVVLIIALIVRSCASSPVKDVEGSNVEVQICLNNRCRCKLLFMRM